MSNNQCCLFVHNFAYFSLFFWKPVFPKIYLNKFKLHHLYMYLYLCVWINLYNNNKFSIYYYYSNDSMVHSLKDEKVWGTSKGGFQGTQDTYVGNMILFVKLSTNLKGTSRVSGGGHDIKLLIKVLLKAIRRGGGREHAWRRNE